MYWGQFHQNFTHEFFVQKFVQSQTLSREKLPKRLSCKKGALKTLKLKLTPGKVGHSFVGETVYAYNSMCWRVCILRQ
jgi:hypothetical protein